MMIIATDNFGRDYVSDRIINPNVTQEEGDKICKKNNSDFNPDYYKVVPNDYNLYIFEP